jgi:uncharacterized delta-60 repeat protein
VAPCEINEGRVALVRLRANGRPDRSFGDAGIAIGPHGSGTDLVRRANGKLVVAIASDSEARRFLGAAQFTRRGALDRGFGHNGRFMAKRPCDDCYAYGYDALALQRTRKSKVVLVGSGAYTDGEGGYPTITRMTKNGKQDRKFDRRAFVPTGDADGEYRGAEAVAVDHAARIYVAGNDEIDHLFASRLEPDGRPDGSFGDRGGASILFDYYARSSSATVTSAGFVIAGVAITDATTDADPDFALVRFDPHGAPDASFGDGGIVTTNFGP